MPESAVAVAGELEFAETAWCLGFDCWLAFLDLCWLIAVQMEAVMEAEVVAEMEALFTQSCSDASMETLSFRKWCCCP